MHEHVATQRGSSANTQTYSNIPLEPQHTRAHGFVCSLPTVITAYISHLCSRLRFRLGGVCVSVRVGVCATEKRKASFQKTHCTTLSGLLKKSVSSKTDQKKKRSSKLSGIMCRSMREKLKFTGAEQTLRVCTVVLTESLLKEMPACL